MTNYHYKQAINKAYECGSVKYDLNKTTNVLKEQFGNDLDCPEGYCGLSILDSYMKGWSKC